MSKSSTKMADHYRDQAGMSIGICVGYVMAMLLGTWYGLAGIGLVLAYEIVMIIYWASKGDP